jgi:glucose/arabinose dehydrogenase/PKD repeat protein
VVRGRGGQLTAALVGVALVAVALVPAPTAAAQATSAFQRSTLISGLEQPTAFALSPDGRVFITTQDGRVLAYDSMDDPTPTTLIDLRTNVHAFHDRGLLGLALHPDFPATPWLYVLYTYDHILGDPAPPPKWGTPTSDACPVPATEPSACVASARLSRFAVSDGSAGPEHVLIEGWCQSAISHSIGEVRFGPDGALYVGAGDAANPFYTDYGQPSDPCADPGAPASAIPGSRGGALVSQDLRTPGDPVSLNGSILRVDPDTGAGLPSNPRGGAADLNERRIVAHGLRNPFRFTFRPGTNELWLGDVGWNSRDEIDRLVDPAAGPVANFGWPCYEGLQLTSYTEAGLSVCTDLVSAGPAAAQAPWLDLEHDVRVTAADDALGCVLGNGSPSGVAFGSAISYPARYDGALFWGDYARQCIWVAFPGHDGLPDPATADVFAAGVFPVDLEVADDGKLYMLDYVSGELVRFDYVGGNAPPQAVLTVSPPYGPAPFTPALDASASFDPDPGEALTFSWDLDADGQFDDATTPSTSATFTDDGSHLVRVRVADEHGAVATTAATVTVGVPNQPPALGEIGGPRRPWTVGEARRYTATAVDAEDGQLPPSAFQWELGIQHCGDQSCHFHHLQSWQGVDEVSFTAPLHDLPSYLDLRVTATDSEGAEATKQIDLQPATTGITATSRPPGAPFLIGDGVRSSLNVIVGSSTSVVAPASFTRGGRRYEFVGWDDGHEQAARQVSVGAEEVALHARYLAVAWAAFALDEGAGRQAHDATGHGARGAVSGATWSSGRSAGGLAFTGEGRVRVHGPADSPALGGTATLAVSLAVNPAPGIRTRQHLAAQRGAWSLELRGEDRVPVATVQTPAGRIAIRAEAGIPADTWSDVALVRRAHRLLLVVDGAVVASRRLPAVVTATGVVVIGRGLHGTVDDVRLYDRALGATALAALRGRAVLPLTS